MNDLYNLKVNINKAQSSKRLDKVLTLLINNFSRTQIKTLIENGNVKKYDQIIKDPSYSVKEGESFEISLLFKLPKKYHAEDLDLDIVFEDEDLIVINKQAGMVTHPAPGNESGTLVNALLNRYTKKNLSEINGESRPGIVHRLDKDTSGIMLVAKNNNSHIKLSEQFKNHSISRKYEAVVWGIPNKKIIEGFIERNKVNRKKMSLNSINKGKYSKTKVILKKNFQIKNLNILFIKIY